MANITIGSDFFKKEARVYQNIAYAFWRELFQNSIDAGATKIDVFMDSSNKTITFTDNGRGMDENTLTNIFFALGNTTKSSIGDSSVGGFGKARIILCFAHHSYTISTQDMFVVGSGGQYEIEKQPYVNGCSFHIEIDQNITWNFSWISIESAFREYTKYLRFNGELNFNGESITLNKISARLVKELTFAKIYHNKSSENNILIVRVCGIPMFTRNISAKGIVVIEVDIDKSRDVFQSNRDGFVHPFQEEYSSFIESLSIDNMSALKKWEPFSIESGSHKKYFIGKRINKNKSKSIDNEYPNESESLRKRIQDSIPLMGSMHVTKSYSDYPVLGGEYTSIITSNKTIEDYSVKVVQKKFQYLANRYQTLDGTKRKLLLQWKVACEYAMDIILPLVGMSDINVKFGFIFDDEVEAMCSKNGSDVTLYLNPVTLAGEIKYKLRCNSCHNKIIALAIHEVCHISESYHDERFANNMTDGIIEAMNYKSQINKDLIGVLGK